MTGAISTTTLRRVLDRLAAATTPDQKFGRNVLDQALILEGLMTGTAPPETKAEIRWKVKEALNKATMSGALPAPWYALEFVSRGRGQLMCLSRMRWECRALTYDIERLERGINRLAKLADKRGDDAADDNLATVRYWAYKQGQLDAVCNTARGAVVSVRQQLSELENMLEAEPKASALPGPGVEQQASSAPSCN